MEQTYTSKEAATILKCSIQIVLRRIKEGNLIAAKVGRQWVIRQSSLDQLLKTLENENQQTVIGIRSKAKCQSTLTSMEYGKYPYAQQAAEELDNLLKPQTAKTRKNCTTKSNTNHGGLIN